MKLKDKIFICRKRAGLSQEALADRMGVSRQAVSKWETGEAEPELAKLRILAETFGVSADWLLSEDDAQDADAGRSGTYNAGPSNAQTPPADQTSAAPGASWVDSIPGAIGRLIRRYGWLFGVYLAVAGTVFTAIGALMRGIASSMQQSFNDSVSGFGLGAFNAFGTTGIMPGYTVTVTDVAQSIQPSNPVVIMGTFVIVLGLVMLAAGVVLAIVLKRRAKD